MREQLLYGINEFQKIIPLSRSGIYKAVKNGEIPSVHVGGRCFIPAWYVNKLVTPPSQQGA